MRTSDERFADVLQKRDEYKKRQKRKNIRLASTMCAACMVLCVCLVTTPVLNFILPSVTPEPSGDDAISPPVILSAGYSAAASYSGIYNVLKEAVNAYYKGSYNGLAENEIYPVPESSVVTDTAKGGSDSADYSSTNIQVKGVDEADIVKTDGSYIYAAAEDKIAVYSVLSGTAELLCVIDMGDDRNVPEMFISENRLCVITSDYGVKSGSEMITSAAVYDITDKSAPVLINTLGQSGSYFTARLVGDYVYLISNDWIFGANIDEDKLSTYVPEIYKNGKGEYVAYDSIYVNSQCVSCYSSCYTVISGINIETAQTVSTKSVLDTGSNVYCSLSNMYVAGEALYKEAESVTANGTAVSRYSLSEGNIALEAQTVVKGNILNQFSMDEYESNFRIVTTVREYSQSGAVNGGITDDIVSVSMDTCANLYVLDSSLATLGSIDDLAPGEQVYSVRFDGATAYFVTFRQTDPLFCADLSDPANPKIKSTLKIPGFSTYMHVFSEGRLFGFGRDADEKTGAAGDMKLTMFNTQNPENVTVSNTLIIRGREWSNALYDHRAILVDGSKNTIVIPVEDAFLVYSYSDADGFKLKAELGFEFDEKLLSYSMQRSFYIGDTLYLYVPGVISMYSMTDFRSVGALRFG